MVGVTQTFRGQTVITFTPLQHSGENILKGKENIWIGLKIFQISVFDKILLKLIFQISIEKQILIIGNIWVNKIIPSCLESLQLYSRIDSQLF